MPSLETLLAELIQYPSITPDDAACQSFVITYLKELGFTVLEDPCAPVSNCFAYIGTGKPFLVFAGHTDVVDPGVLSDWNSDPFLLTKQDNCYIGRGVADMKGALAAMLFAARTFLRAHPAFQGRLGFLLTSGEEGDHYHQGTPHIMRTLKAKNLLPDYCVIGEPTSEHTLADTIKVGRRGSLNADIRVSGKQGHVAYPDLAINPIHILAPVLQALTTQIWDHGNEYFPPTRLQITQLQTHLDSFNVIPGTLNMKINFRFSNEHTHEFLQEKVEALFHQHQVRAEFQWRLSGAPFITPRGVLVEKTLSAIKDITGHTATLSTTGGTSDGRFIAPYGIDVIELGLSNKTIHQVNESIDKTSLEQLARIYTTLCNKVFCKARPG